MTLNLLSLITYSFVFDMRAPEALVLVHVKHPYQAKSPSVIATQNRLPLRVEEMQVSSAC